MFSVCLCARFQSCSKESHFIAIKRIIRYLKGTIGMALWYLKTGHFSMTSYSDANYVGCRYRKSTSGTCHFFKNYLILWSSKKQNSVALSTAEGNMLQPGLVVHKFFG